MFFHNVSFPSLIEILYIHILNLNGGILQLDVKKFLGHLCVGLRNLFWNIFDAVWDLILCIKTRLFKILSWNTFKILLSRNSSLACANLSLQCMIRMAWFSRLLIFLKICSIGTSPDYISIINAGTYEGII